MVLPNKFMYNCISFSQQHRLTPCQFLLERSQCCEILTLLILKELPFISSPSLHRFFLVEKFELYICFRLTALLALKLLWSSGTQTLSPAGEIWLLFIGLGLQWRLYQAQFQFHCLWKPDMYYTPNICSQLGGVWMELGVESS